MKSNNIRSVCRASALVQGKVAKWWIPDDVAFVKDIPHTATGKVYKLKLRQQFQDFKFSGSKL